MADKWIYAKLIDGTTPKNFRFEGLEGVKYTGVMPGIVLDEKGEAINRYCLVLVDDSLGLKGISRDQLPEFEREFLDMFEKYDEAKPHTADNIGAIAKLDTKDKAKLLAVAEKFRMTDTTKDRP